MFQSPILDVAIGLSFIYLFISLICMAINEAISTFTSMRANTLKTAIAQILSDPKKKEEMINRVYDSHFIASLSPDGKKPSYIPSAAFANALLDTLSEAGKGFDFKTIQASIDSLGNPLLRNTLTKMASTAGNDIGKLKQNIEDHFNDVMERASGWYKRDIQVFTVALSFVVVGFLNVDTLSLAKRLYREPAFANSLVAEASSVVAKYSPSSTSSKDNTGTKPVLTPDFGKMTTEINTMAESLPFPLGDWKDKPDSCDWMGWVRKILGLLITISAVSLGAPFWFDTLTRFVQVRGTGAKPKVSQTTDPDSSAKK